MSFSLSTREGHMIGRSLDAQSSSLNKSTVAANARSAAFRACTKGSRRERPKAAARTFARLYKHVNKTERKKDVNQLTFTPRLRAILPRQIVVFVRIPGCSSFAVLARCLKSSPLITRSESFGTTVKTALTVCSRTTGATSENPVTFQELAG